MMIGRALIDALDEAGYLTGSLDELADRLGASLAQVEAVLARLQQLEPTGVFARDLAECLSLQLIERDRFDPAMRALSPICRCSPGAIMRACAGFAASTTKISRT